jgi:hypothetical protein
VTLLRGDEICADPPVLQRRGIFFYFSAPYQRKQEYRRNTADTCQANLQSKILLINFFEFWFL